MNVLSEKKIAFHITTHKAKLTFYYQCVSLFTVYNGIELDGPVRLCFTRITTALKKKKKKKLKFCFRQDFGVLIKKIQTPQLTNT